MSKVWTPDFDMASVPYEVLFSHMQSLRATKPGKTQNGGRPRSCGHTKWVKSCEVCQHNLKRTAYRERIAQEAEKEA